jgi:hypothetical protein
MGSRDYYLEGAWNARCQECWKKIKSSEALKRWDGFWVCWRCYEIRNPQDFARGIPDNQGVPWSTGNPPPIFIDTAGSAVPVNDYGMLLNSYYLNSKMLG